MSRSSVDVDDGAISSTGLGLRRTRPPWSPVGGQERFFGERCTPTKHYPDRSEGLSARHGAPWASPS